LGEEDLRRVLGSFFFGCKTEGKSVIRRVWGLRKKRGKAVRLKDPIQTKTQTRGLFLVVCEKGQKEEQGGFQLTGGPTPINVGERV